MYHIMLDEENEIISTGEMPLPFTSFQFGNLLITDEKLLKEAVTVKLALRRNREVFIN